jgi:hypothetical protein
MDDDENRAGRRDSASTSRGRLFVAAGPANPMAFLRRSNRPLLTLLIAVSCSSAWALPQSTLPAYTAHLEALNSLLESCRANAAACDASKVGSNEQVNLAGLNAGANVNSFEAHYDWLRKTLSQAHNPAMKNRDDALNSAISRVQNALQDAGNAATPAGTSGDFTRARASANTILNHPEFVTVSNTSIWDRVIAHIYLWLDSLFSNVAKFGQRSPWIGPLLEWSLIVLTLTGLALWAMRVLRRQRLKVKIEATRQIEPWEEASRNWRAQAAEQAARQDWREAVHCLYWASIVMLEGRRFWTPNVSRTPREYLHLLEAESPRWTLLSRQTLGFERIWYGLRAADARDYQSALALHEELRSA